MLYNTIGAMVQFLPNSEVCGCPGTSWNLSRCRDPVLASKSRASVAQNHGQRRQYNAELERDGEDERRENILTTATQPNEKATAKAMATVDEFWRNLP